MKDDIRKNRRGKIRVLWVLAGNEKILVFTGDDLESC